MGAVKRVTCRYHCSGCRSHFSSLNAFEAHRFGDHATGRDCDEPADDDRFAAVAENGLCSMYSQPRVGVAVWTLAEDLARARERSGGSERAAATPTEAHVASLTRRAA